MLALGSGRKYRGSFTCSLAGLPLTSRCVDLFLMGHGQVLAHSPGDPVIRNGWKQEGRCAKLVWEAGPSFLDGPKAPPPRRAWSEPHTL